MDAEAHSDDTPDCANSQPQPRVDGFEYFTSQATPPGFRKRTSTPEHALAPGVNDDRGGAQDVQ